MAKGVKKLGKTIREYNGLIFTYLPNIKSPMKARLAVHMNGEYTGLKFYTISECVKFIDDEVMRGAVIKDNRLIINQGA